MPRAAPLIPLVLQVVLREEITITDFVYDFHRRYDSSVYPCPFCMRHVRVLSKDINEDGRFAGICPHCETPATLRLVSPPPDRAEREKVAKIKTPKGVIARPAYLPSRERVAACKAKEEAAQGRQPMLFSTEVMRQTAWRKIRTPKKGQA